MNRKTRLFAAATIFICIIMAFAGLKPKGFRFHNDVSRLADKNGLRFGKFGIAYTDKNQPLSFKQTPESLSIELVIKVPKQHRDHLDVIFDLWDDRSPRHLTLCQWDSTLIVMKSNTRYFKNSRLHLGKSVSPKQVYFVTITSHSNHGTNLYINGVHAESSSRFDLCDSNASIGRLVVGNSPNANNPWQGEIYKLSIFDKVLSKEEILERYQQWLTNQPMPDTGATLASYTFEENSGEIAHDLSRKLGDLHVPSRFFIPQKQILSSPREDFKFSKSYASDIFVNLFGFVPFGVFFSALLWSMGGFARRHRLTVCLLVGGCISLFFELAQVYIPTRNSQMSDVILNVLGTLIGVLAASRFYLNIKQPYVQRLYQPKKSTQ